MIYKIDQSGKIEQTEKDTVLAAVNSKEYSVIVIAKDKRRLQESFRLAGKPELFIYAVFATILAKLIKSLTSKNVIVDKEYSGQTKIIEKMIKNLDEKIIITWKTIGKNSSAHELAYKTFKGKLRANKRLTYEEIWPKAIKIAGGYLNSTTLRENRHSAPAYKKIVPQNAKKSRYQKIGS